MRPHCASELTSASEAETFLHPPPVMADRYRGRKHELTAEPIDPSTAHYLEELSMQLSSNVLADEDSDLLPPSRSMGHLGPNDHYPMWPRTRSNSAGSKLSDLGSDMKAEESSLGMIRRKKSASNLASIKCGEEELCLICGDRASGYHYNALSCEGCKGFFRRSITRAAEYTCKTGGNCEMDMWMRRRCQYCRLRRCREVGMKEECLLSDEQCRARDVRRKSRQKLQKPQCSEDVVAEVQMSPERAPSSTSSEQPTLPVADPLKHINTEYRDLIEKLVMYQDRYELPSEKDMKKVAGVRVSDEGRPASLSESIYKHMAEMTILVTHLVVEFAKQLPGFLTLEKDDQIVLLKGSASEVMMLRSARRYDLATDTVIFGDGMPYTREALRYAGMHDYVESMFDFCKGMATLGVDNAEYALLTAMCIFQERPGLVKPLVVEDSLDIYLFALMAYIRLRRPRGTNFLAKLLMKLTVLRQLSIEHSDVLFALKVEKGSLPPLLMEYFDIKEI